MSNIIQHHDTKLSSNHIPAISRAVSVLGALSTSEKPLRLAELARELDIPRSSLFSILVTLVEEGLVERENRTYRVGERLIQLARTSTDGRWLVRAARPVLTRLVAELSESAQVAVLDDRQARYVVALEGTQMLRVATWVGKRNPLGQTSIGKSLILDTPADRLRELVPDMDDSARERLREELTRSRERGYTTDDGQGEAGVYCIAAPIRNISGQIIAALSVSAPQTRLTSDGAPRFAELVMHAARDIAENIGSPER